MIYSGFGSSFEFSELQIRIQVKVPDPYPDTTYIYKLSIFRNNTKTHLKFNQKEEY